MLVVVLSKTSGLAGLLHIKSLISPPATVTAVRQGLPPTCPPGGKHDPSLIGLICEPDCLTGGQHLEIIYLSVPARFLSNIWLC